MLTRKHFKGMAEKNMEGIERIKKLKCSPDIEKVALAAARIMVTKQAQYLLTQNPNFNWDKFLRASGVEPLEEN